MLMDCTLQLRFIQRESSPCTQDHSVTDNKCRILLHLEILQKCALDHNQIANVDAPPNYHGIFKFMF